MWLRKEWKMYRMVKEILNTVCDKGRNNERKNGGVREIVKISLGLRGNILKYPKDLIYHPAHYNPILLSFLSNN
jgi:hypothetical protein